MNVSATLTTALAGRYEIEQEIGAGGMATVYLARDLKHERQVALKVLRPELGAVLGVERFLAEIRVTANLQHPHLLPLFDSGEANGLLFYVMPYVPGESLRAKLEREGQLAIDESVRIAVAVASALSYAHRNHVVHRDLKPENILLQDGEPVVTDFGIALAVSNAGGARVTQTGLSLGTPAYMSPEQAAGDRVIDARSDVYSLGAVLYEMLIGEPPHTGANVQKIISRILTEEPRGVSEQRPTVPVAIDEAVHRALAKLPADRFASAKDFGEALRVGLNSTPLPRRYATEAVRSARGASLARFVPWGVAAAAATAAAFAFKRPAVVAPAGPLVRFTVAPAGGLRPEFTEVAISADGRRLLLSDGPVSSRRVYTRLLGEADIVELPALARTQSHFLSPNGQSIGYIAEGRIRTIPVAGGEDTPIVPVPDGPMRDLPSWGTGGVIVYTRPDSSGIWAVDAAGGDGRRVTNPDVSNGEEDTSPSFLPDGRRFLFDRRVRRGQSSVMLGDLDGPERALGITGFAPRYAANHVLTSSVDGAITAVEVNPSTYAPVGTQVSLLTLTGVRGPRRTPFAVSQNGVLAFVEPTPRRSDIVVVDRDGKFTPFVTTARSYGSPAMSPDGQSIAVEVMEEAGGSNIWIFDKGGTSRRLTQTGRNIAPAWSPDGEAIAWSSEAAIDEPAHIMVQRVDGSEPANELLSNDGMLRPLSFSPDGDSVRVVSLGRGVPRLLSVSIRTHGTSEYRTVGGERGGSISPDGKWYAYTATEDARSEVFVRPSGSTSPVVRVSMAGGEHPRWARDGRALYYRDSTSMVEVALALTPTFRVVSRQVLFTDPYDRGGMGSYDVGAGGRFAMLHSEEARQHVDVIANLGTLIRTRSAAADRARAAK